MFYMEIIFFFIFWFSGTSESFLFFDWSEPFYYVNNLTLHHWAYWWLSLWLELHRLLIGISCLFLYNIHVEKLWQQRIKALCYNKYKRRDRVFIISLIKNVNCMLIIHEIIVFHKSHYTYVRARVKTRLCIYLKFIYIIWWRFVRFIKYTVQCYLYLHPTECFLRQIFISRIIYFICKCIFIATNIK